MMFNVHSATFARTGLLTFIHVIGDKALEAFNRVGISVVKRFFDSFDLDIHAVGVHAVITFTRLLLFFLFG